MITRWTTRWRRLRRWFSRSEWDVRLLGLPRSQETGAAPGLVLIQIDGLARPQLERALKAGRMPFLKKLMEREGYQLHDFYSGQPATTPAVQGELFYGQKCAVPSFDFYDRQTCEIKRMFSAEPAVEVEERLKAGGKTPLLQGGSAYCDIYSGGAEEVHFCSVNAGLPSKRRAVHPLRRLLFGLWHCMSIVRTAALVLVELVVALVDVCRGLARGHEIGPEFRAILSRVIVSVMLREMATIGASMDIARGLPIIHLNYLGYDEQSHRRGPSSRFAHWALRSIDNAIRQLSSAAGRSEARDYDVWIYSDHGQEHSHPYQHEHEKSVQDVIAELIQKHLGVKVGCIDPAKKYRASRSAWLGGWFVNWFFGAGEEKGCAEDEAVSITAAGPVGHVYLKHSHTVQQQDLLARALVAEAGIPLVMRRQADRSVRAFTAEGEFELPRDAADVLGAEHPFLDEVSVDLAALCHHRDAGDLVICGFRKNELELTFPIENGSHAGPGYSETNGFSLLPADAPLPRRDHTYLRASDLRGAVLHRLEREPLTTLSRGRRSKEPETFSIMTFNVHSCVGMDGKLSPARIARVIEQSGADVIALQELDVRRPRSGAIDQAHEIARLVGMHHHFHPALRMAEEAYGDAILCHFPMRLIHAGPLPGLSHRSDLEPRGALWVEITVNGTPIQVINTHLGLSPLEKVVQVEELLGANWLGHPDCRGPVIFCGDLNCGPVSRTYRQIAHRFKDAQRQLKGHRIVATWPSNAPFHRIDHVFISPEIQVRQVVIPRTILTRVASDHLPVLVSVGVEPARSVPHREGRADVVSQHAPT